MDEAAIELAPQVSLISGDLRHGRIVDAFTGRVVSGATIETWTEENDADMGGFFRIGEATSRIDGCFSVQATQGHKQAEKVRIAAAGYCTLSTTLGDISNEIMLFPAPTIPTRIRVVDSHGRGIPGAQFTSTRTCAHDVPAFSENTDARGWATLAKYGLQDESPDLRLRATGFGAIKYLDSDEAFAPAPNAEPFTVRLKQRAPVHFRLLTKQGQPWQGASVMVHDNDGFHVIRTDADGRLSIESRYGNGPNGWYVLESPTKRYLATVPTFPGAMVTVRDQAESWPDETPTGELVIKLQNVDPRFVWACHSDGWLHQLDKEEGGNFEFPAGKGQLLVGGAFTGAQPMVIPFEVTAGKRTSIAAVAAREPMLRVLEPDGEDSELWVQGAGETLDGAPFEETFPVPADVELCFIYESHGEVRRVCIDSATDGQLIDMRPANTIIKATPTPAHQASESFNVPAAATLHLGSPNLGCTLGNKVEGTQILTGPMGAPYLVELRTPGRLPTWLRGRIPHAAKQAIELKSAPYAKLNLITDSNTSVVGFDVDDLNALAPGPLHLVLLSSDGRRIGLQLDLEPGEERMVRIQR